MKPAVSQILALLFLTTVAASCKKSDANTGSPAKSKTILLTQASWKIQTVSQDTNNDGTGDVDITSSVQACELDNTYAFKTDSAGIMDEAATKCNSTDPQTKSFTWIFKSNQTVLSGTFNFSDGDATIISMNDTNLVVAYDDNFGTATTYHLIATLKH